MRIAFICFLGMLAMLCGCGREERSEAVRFCKVLNQQRADLATFVEIETSFLDGAKSWCGSVIANGAGRGDQLNQNAEVAGDLAKSADVLSAQLGLIRQAVYNEVLKTDGTRGIRSNLIDQLAQRQRNLQDLRVLLQDTAPVFLQFKQDRAYAADTYPGGITELNTRLQGYRGPAAVLEEAIAELKDKYNITDADLGT